MVNRNAITAITVDEEARWLADLLESAERNRYRIFGVFIFVER